MGLRQSKVIDTYRAKAFENLDNSRHVMMLRSMKKNQGHLSPYIQRMPYPRNDIAMTVEHNVGSFITWKKDVTLTTA